ncbi:unnamed protein product [Amoebophrya sp. A25]|nr:unnamed protein product [Amoebophrya sp. A25]|eukprot:GSA25T00018447001.1
MKKRILKKLRTLDVPFCLLVPTSMLQGPLLREIFDAEEGVDATTSENSKDSKEIVETTTSREVSKELRQHWSCCPGETNALSSKNKRSLLQVLLPSKVLAYPIVDGKCKEKPVACKSLAWLCYKMNLPKDVYFI